MSAHMQNLKNYIKQERIEVCHTLWKKFDKGAKGYVESPNLVIMLRLLDYNPTESEIDEMLSMIDPDDKGERKVTKDFFFACVARKERDTDDIEEFLNCFRLFDPLNTGLIEEKVLRYIMANMGGKTPLSNEEVDAMMKEANTAQVIEVQNELNYIKYPLFAKYLKDLYKPPPKDDKKGKNGKK
ncbi:MAG: hypothetical protein MJ252_05745 [archaeon]|nr:hypothetical protein [archaeon]